MNREDALRALAAVTLDPTQDLESVWRRDPFHVDGMQPHAMAQFRRLHRLALDSDGPSPLGLVIQGRKGSGKTHFLGQVRRASLETSVFVFGVVLDGYDFWRSVAYTYARSLLYDGLEGTQLQVVLADLGALLDWPDEVRTAIAEREPLDRATIDALVLRYRERRGRTALETQDVLRALLLLASPVIHAQDIGHSYLTSVDLDRSEYLDWGFRFGLVEPRRVVERVSALIALVRPQIFAVDQIDALVFGLDTNSDDVDPRKLENLLQVFRGLMDLRDAARRTLILVSCLTSTWQIAMRKVVTTVVDRFEQVELERTPSPELGEALIRNRFAPAYARVHFEPPWPTWPVAATAFQDAPDYFPRRLIQVVKQHLERCVALEEVLELDSLGEVTEQGPEALQRRRSPPSLLEQLDERFKERFGAADVAGALDPDREDQVVPELLHAALTALRFEDPRCRDLLTVSDLPREQPPALHAKLHYEIDAESDRHQVWSFRAIGHTHAVAGLTRLRAAATSSGIRASDPDRFLVLIRNVDWPGGPKAKTTKLLEQLHADGARTFAIHPEDLATFAALRDLLADRPEGLVEWLEERRPASSTSFLKQVFAWAPRLTERPASPSEAENAPADPPTPSVEPPDATLPLGDSRAGDRITVPLAVLRRHVVVFAGSGSGKTVLLRRLVEEAALRGVSSIVLDPNNDLARLGDRAPEPPEPWRDGDAELADAYHEHTEVRIFTPRRPSGRALAFRPLPDFAALRDDDEALEQAIEVAVAALAPPAFAEGTRARAAQSRAVLKAALAELAGGRFGDGLDAFVELLRDPPAGLANLPDSAKLATEMANNLQAARINDPLFGGEGEAADPGALLTPSRGKRACVSVISFVGLPDDTQRQSFVNQLQMSLFSWARQNPARDRPLSGLLVMDEAQTFAPSGRVTPCTESTLSLASQARKYGLGLVFATQAPKGLHNRIPGNATTQFFGRLSAPAHIAAAKEMAQTLGGRVDDIGRLGAGQFYVASEDVRLQKVWSRYCLSHHPPSALTEEEVLERARG